MIAFVEADPLSFGIRVDLWRGSSSHVISTLITGWGRGVQVGGHRGGKGTLFAVAWPRQSTRCCEVTTTIGAMLKSRVDFRSYFCSMPSLQDIKENEKSRRVFFLQSILRRISQRRGGKLRVWQRLTKHSMPRACVGREFMAPPSGVVCCAFSVPSLSS